VSLITGRKSTFVFILFGLLAVILRFFSFFPSVIDHDESTYLEIARMILSGKLLYVDMVDIKPPGIFLILAFFQGIFGQSIFIMRLLSALWIALTAFMIYKSARVMIKDDRASLAAGIIYIFFISTWTFYGISITPEIFFNLFTISALYLILKKQSPLYLFLAGLSAGMGFLVKYLVIADFAAIILFLIIIIYQKEKKPGLSWAVFSVFIMGIGFLLPFSILNLVYYQNGHFAELFNIVYLAPGRYPSSFDLLKMLKYILSFHLLFIPVFFFFYYTLLDKQKLIPKPFRLRMFFIIWILMTLAAVVAAGKTFGHYTIQLMLPVSLVAGVFFHSDRLYPLSTKRVVSLKNGRILLAVVIIGISLMKVEYMVRKDVPREIAAYLEKRMSKADVIYAGNYHHILYYLLEKDSPTKYIHRSLLLNKKHIRALDINVDEEFRKIISSQPVYIVVHKQYPDGMFKKFVDANYRIEKEFEDSVFLYRRIDM
jgi:4-amino-4-deoxy-L-arabinose transferase-like glycosyltransferase